MTRPISWALVVAGLAVAACSSDDGKKANLNPGGGGSGGTGAKGGTGGTTGGTGGASGAAGGGGLAGNGGLAGSGGVAGGGGSTGGTGGLAGSSGAAGSGGGNTGGTGGSTAVCGDKVVGGTEECDGTDFNGRTCATYGFSSGQLSCKGDCTIDSTACTGTENCNDGADNDGDQKIDCADTDCTSKCATACTTPPTLPDPASVSGTTTGHGDSLKASCSSGTGGPDVAYEVTAANAGIFEAKIGTLQNMTVSLRSACSSSGPELGCSASNRVKAQVTQGQKLWVIVDGASSSDAGLFTLSTKSHSIACGDGSLDGSEACDDGNVTPGDGCSATCTVEASESEPNDNSGQASNYTSGAFYGTISSASDVDFIAVTIATAGSTLSVSNFDFGDGGCAYGEIDSVLEIRGTNGTSVLATDDNSGDGKCSKVSASGLAAGKYYVVVKAAGGASPFAYKLLVSVF